MANMRRLGFLLAILVAAGCVPSTDGERVLRVANWGGAGEDGPYEKMVQEFYRDFERKHPGVRVQMEGIPGQYTERMVLNFVAGTQPDVVTLDSAYAPIFIDNGFLEDLSPRIAKDPEFKLDDYYPNVVEMFSRDGKPYGIPNDFTPMVVYYNKDLFDAAGVPYPKAGWTFEDFRVTAKALTKTDQYGFAFSNWMPGWVMWLWNNGGAVFDPEGDRTKGHLDSPESAGAVQFLADVILKDKSSPSLSEAASMGVDLFADGRAAMTVSGHWMIPTYKNAKKIDWKRLGVAPMPSNTGNSQTVMYGSAFAVAKGAKESDLAWEFVKEWTSYRLQKAYQSSGIALSARKDVNQERINEPMEREFVEIVPSARPSYGSYIEGYPVVEKLGKAALDSILNNGTPVETALSRAAERIDREFAKSR